MAAGGLRCIVLLEETSPETFYQRPAPQRYLFFDTGKMYATLLAEFGSDDSRSPCHKPYCTSFEQGEEECVGCKKSGGRTGMNGWVSMSALTGFAFITPSPIL